MESIVRLIPYTFFEMKLIHTLIAKPNHNNKTTMIIIMSLYAIHKIEAFKKKGRKCVGK